MHEQNSAVCVVTSPMNMCCVMVPTSIEFLDAIGFCPYHQIPNVQDVRPVAIYVSYCISKWLGCLVQDVILTRMSHTVMYTIFFAYLMLNFIVTRMSKSPPVGYVILDLRMTVMSISFQSGHDVSYQDNF